MRPVIIVTTVNSAAPPAGPYEVDGMTCCRAAMWAEPDQLLE